jgi:hypothetical protein
MNTLVNEKKEIETQVMTEILYGMGAPCQAILPESEIKAKTVREIIVAIVNSPQPTVLAFRAARTIADVIASGRQFDIEFSTDSNAKATPIEVRDKVNYEIPHIEKLTIKISEPYVGGQKND